jgi:hypothetical protein
MRLAGTLALLSALLVDPAAATAAPRLRLGQRPALELRAALRTLSERRAYAAHVLRELPTPVERPGAYALVSRWVEQVALPRADGTPKLVVVTVPGGLGLAWARRW